MSSRNILTLRTPRRALGPPSVCGASLRTSNQGKGSWGQGALGKVNRRALNADPSPGTEHTSRPCAPEPVIQLRGPLTSWCRRFREEMGGCRGGQRPARKSWVEAGRINYEAGKCLAVPGFIQAVGGVSPWLEATGLYCVLADLCTTMLFPPTGVASGGQDPYPPRAWPKAAAWSIFSEWIKVNAAWFIIKRGKTRVPGLDIKE